MANAQHEEFQKIVDEMKVDFEKFYDKGNSSAGTRVRKHLQALATLCKDTRKDVTEVKNTRKETK
jgi:hypothetical protein